MRHVSVVSASAGGRHAGADVAKLVRRVGDRVRKARVRGAAGDRRRLEHGPRVHEWVSGSVLPLQRNPGAEPRTESATAPGFVSAQATAVSAAAAID